MEGSSGLENLGFVGTPLIGNDEILAIGHGRNESKLSLYCLDFAGKQKWTAELGTVRKRSTNSGYEKMPQPAMLKRGRTLFIATEDGALAAFDLPERKIRWTLPYGIADRSGSRQRIFYSGQSDDRTQLHTETVLLEHDGLIYVKEAGGRELLAIDPPHPRSYGGDRPKTRHNSSASMMTASICSPKSFFASTARTARSAGPRIFPSWLAGQHCFRRKVDSGPYRARGF